jgi:hypothetical protein
VWLRSRPKIVRASLGARVEGDEVAQPIPLEAGIPPVPDTLRCSRLLRAAWYKMHVRQFGRHHMQHNQMRSFLRHCSSPRLFKPGLLNCGQLACFEALYAVLE